MFQLWFLIPLNPFPQPLQPVPFTYESVPPWDYWFHWILCSDSGNYEGHHIGCLSLQQDPTHLGSVCALLLAVASCAFLNSTSYQHSWRQLSLTQTPTLLSLQAFPSLLSSPSLLNSSATLLTPPIHLYC